MSKYSLILIAVFALLLAGCGGASNNANSAANNTNAANASTRARRSAPPPDVATLMGMERNVFEALKNKDASFFQEYLADTFVSFGPDGRLDKAAAVDRLTSRDCTVNGYSFSDEALTLLGPDAVGVTYKAQADVTCAGQKLPGPVWNATVYQREGDKWRAVYHNEVPVLAAGSPQAVDQPGKPAAEDAPIDSFTQGLLNVENAAWQAMQKKDQKVLDALTMQDLVYIDPAGSGRHNKEAAMKLWTDASCKIEGYALTDPQSRPLGSNLAILTFRGAPKGSCGGRPLRPVWATTVYMKEANMWKAIMVVHSPA